MWRHLLAMIVVAALALLGMAAHVADAGAGNAAAAPMRTSGAAAEAGEAGEAGGAGGALHEAGRAVYNFRCYFCHGYSGDARTLAASWLEPAPRDFTRGGLDAARIVAVLESGRPGTAMASFAGTLSRDEMRAVAAFVEREFVRERAVNTRYHTAENGWPDHQRYAAAFPFARGEIALDAGAETLDAEQQRGRRLFLGSCISCHDRARVLDPGPAWSLRPVSYPRIGFVPGQSAPATPDATSGASIYARHEVPPPTAGLDASQRRGAGLFQAHCAFCHAADGSGRNWIGQFMQPPARDLTQYTLQTMPAERLAERIRDGLAGTSMPAWRHVLAPREIADLVRFVSGVLYQRRPLQQAQGPTER